MAGAPGRKHDGTAATWVVRQIDLLVPASLHDDQEAQLRGRVLVGSCFGLALLALAALVVRVTTAPFDRGAIVSFATVAVIMAIPWVQRWTGSHRSAGAIFASVSLLTLPIFHLLLGFFPAPALLFFPVVPLLAAFFVGVRFGLLMSVASSLVIIALKLGLSTPSGEQMGTLSWTFAAIAVAMCFMTALTALIYEHGRMRNNVALREASARAEAANLSKSEFLSNMSHELRTPLTAILGYSELLLDELDEAGEGRYSDDIKKIHGAGVQLRSLINDLLDISRIEAGRVDLESREFSLAALFAEVRETTAPLAAANGNTVEFAIAGELPDMCSDRHRLRQVLLNLASNACKFTSNGHVTLSASLAPDDPRKVLLRVADNGAGLTAEQIGQIFEPFVQVHASIDRRRQGSGLGLTISRGIAEALGGTITVTSEPGRGTEFTVRLPRVSADSRVTG